MNVHYYYYYYSEESSWLLPPPFLFIIGNIVDCRKMSKKNTRYYGRDYYQAFKTKYSEHLISGHALNLNY